MPASGETPAAVTRRDLLKLGTAVSALGLSLGLGATPAEGAETIFVKVEVDDTVYLKFFKIAENNSPRPEMLRSVDLTRDFATDAMRSGADQLSIKLYAASGRDERVVMEQTVRVSPQKQRSPKG